MDFPTEVSPSKFSMLPEDIKARIIRRAGGGTITKQHQESTINDRIVDAGTKSFSNEELSWLLNIRKTLAIMYEYEGICEIKILVARFNRDDIDLIHTTSIETNISDERAEIYSEDVRFDGREEISKGDIKFDLVDRYDTQITQESNVVVSYKMI
jgi:hypothetical protein